MKSKLIICFIDQTSSSFNAPTKPLSTSKSILGPCPIDWKLGGTSTDKKTCFPKRRAGKPIQWYKTRGEQVQNLRKKVHCHNS